MGIVFFNILIQQESCGVLLDLNQVNILSLGCIDTSHNNIDGRYHTLHTSLLNVCKP